MEEGACGDDYVDGDSLTSCAKVENHVMLSELEQNLIKEGEEVSGASCSSGYAMGTLSEGDGQSTGKTKRKRRGPLGRFLPGKKGHHHQEVVNSSPAIPEVVEENSV